MNYALIRKNDIANGLGVRVSLFVSGCRHHCKGCFNPETWNFSYGKPFTEETIEEILAALNHSHIAGLSLLGGDLNKRFAIRFIQRFKFLETLVAGQDEDLVGTGQNASQLFFGLQLILGIVFQLLTFLTNLSADTLPRGAGSVLSVPDI